MYSAIKAYYQSALPHMTGSEWQALEQRLTVQQLAKGEALVRQGETCRQVSFINSGLLRMYYLVDGREICTGFMNENNYISQYDSFLLQQPSPAFIDALEDTEVVNLSYADMQELYLQHPVFQVFGRKIAEQLFIMLTSQNTRLLTLTPEERYQSVIDCQPYVVQRVPQYMIASFIGITPEHLSRLRGKRKSKQIV
jgi:CRP-like cAMP-binding protein